MIATTQKPFDEIIGALEGYEKIAVIGCNGCAKVCMTGGDEQVDELAGRLRDQGKEVVLEATPDRTCYVDNTHATLDPNLEQLKQADAVIVMGCGGAVQITRKVTEDYGLIVPVKTALDSVGHMDTLVSGELALEQCQECGECILNETGGICPVTKCPKGLLNGPCGGSENGKCEVNPERDCAWVMIYNRMSALGELDKLKRFMAPKDYGKMAKPRTLNIKERKVS
ncbi:MAG: methylenetetrahydrofolate reductase C-terminal domain-containing protein [Deltaproteobacteria bacterium]|nr:methylenetetrahydrofolate reductase C-terminal domain-containing protein [Deltaproteobacteria bacterium]